MFSLYDLFISVYLARFSLERTETNLVSALGHKKALQELDAHVDALFVQDGNYPPGVSVPSFEDVSANLRNEDGPVAVTREMYDQLMADKLIFQTLNICGDIVVYEYISSLSHSGKQAIVMMHAGHGHTNRIKRWLVAGSYDVAHERVAEMAKKDRSFIEDRFI